MFGFIVADVIRLVSFVPFALLDVIAAEYKRIGSVCPKGLTYFINQTPRTVTLGFSGAGEHRTPNLMIANHVF